MGPVYISDPTGVAATITAYAASPSSLISGNSAVLSWTTTNATRWFITPEIGWVTGASATVHPTTTTTYTLEAEGPYGSTTRTVQVVVTP